jgi:hypothetical protein
VADRVVRDGSTCSPKQAVGEWRFADAICPFRADEPDLLAALTFTARARLAEDVPCRIIRIL